MQPTASNVVMHTPRIHLIYWLPSGSHLVTSGDATADSRLETRLQSFVSDLGGMGIFKMLAQYPDAAGDPSSVSLAGTTVYTKAYPTVLIDHKIVVSKGTTLYPLTYSDLTAAISDVLATQPTWKPTLEDEYLLVLPTDAEACFSSGIAAGQCTWGATRYWGYHNWFTTQNNDTVIFGVVTTGRSHTPLALGGTYPNGIDEDGPVFAASHELIETITDPTDKGWTGALGFGDEIGDKCGGLIGPVVNPDGGNVKLASGHSYVVQQEWSNALGGCTLDQPPLCSESSACPDSYGPLGLTFQCSPSVDFYLVDSYVGTKSLLDTGSSFYRAADTYPYDNVWACPQGETPSATSCSTYSSYRPKTTWCGPKTNPTCPTGEHWCGAVERCQRLCY